MRTLGWMSWPPPNHIGQKHVQKHGSGRMGHVPGDVTVPAGIAEVGNLIFICVVTSGGQSYSYSVTKLHN